MSALIDSGEGVFRKDLWYASTGYTPHPGQLEVHQNNTRHRALSNGRRWGKTLFGGKEVEPTAFVRNMLNNTQRGWVVGPNYTDCEKEFRVVWDTFRKLDIIPQLCKRAVNNKDSGNMSIQTDWGWVLECRSAAHPESLVGEGLDFVLLVEAGRLRRRMFTQYIRPALSDLRGWSLSSGVPEIATSESLLYWAYSRGQDPSKLQWASWKMPSWTNTVTFPGGRTDPEILEAEDELTSDEFKRQYGGEFVEKYGRVMKEWDDDIHLANLKYNPDWPLYLAIDYGYTNPFVILWIQVDRWDNVYVIGEHYLRYQDTQVICEQSILPHPLYEKIVAFYPDPARPDDTAIMERLLKRPARANTGGEIKTRDGLTRQKLKQNTDKIDPDTGLFLPGTQPGMLVDRSCTGFAWEMREGYRWPEHKDEADKNDSENPMDKDNHGPEAIGRFMKGYFDIVAPEKMRSRMGRVRYKR